MTSAIEKFNLTEITSVTVDGVQWVVYSDGEHRIAVLADDLAVESSSDQNPEHIANDYSEWCLTSRAAGDPRLCARIARQGGLSGIHSSGPLTWIAATSFHVGDEIEAGDPVDLEEHDTGRITDIVGNEIEVAWDSGVTTTQDGTDGLRHQGA